MKKIWIVLGLAVLSMNAIAEDSSARMVLESVHGKGFSGCDDVIRNKFGSKKISYVESKLIFPKITDEVSVIVGKPARVQNDFDSSIESFLIRKVGKECLITDDFSVSDSIQRGCQKVADAIFQSNYAVVSEVDEGFWVRPSDPDKGWDDKIALGGSTRILTPLRGGGCRLISIPEDYSQYLKK